MHMTLNLLVTAADAVGFLWRRAGSGPVGNVGAGRLALSAVNMAVLAVSGVLDGKLAYRYGVRVADEAIQAHRFDLVGNAGRKAVARRPHTPPTHTPLLEPPVHGTRILGGGLRPQPSGASRMPTPVIFGYFALAVVDLAAWTAYPATDRTTVAWTAFAFGLLLPVALLGFPMPARWIPVYQARSVVAAAPTAPPRGLPSRPSRQSATSRSPSSWDMGCSLW